MEKIRIAQPCHQNWDAMTPNEQGRFCSSCVKNVHDVSNLTDQEIWKKYAENGNNLCIRIPKERLAETQSKWFSRIKYAAVTSLVIWFSSIKNNLMAQVTTPQDKDTLNEKSIEKLTITGVVKDTVDTEKPIAYATILLYKNDQRLGGAYSNEDGTFKLEINDTISSTDSLKMVVKYLGYQDAIKEISLLRDTIDCEVYMKNNHICLKESVIMTPSGEMLGEISIKMGKMISTDKFIKKDTNTKTIKSFEPEQLNLGR